MQDYQGTALIVKDPMSVFFARVAQYLDTTPKAAVGIHPSAQIDLLPHLGEGVAMGRMRLLVRTSF